MQQLIDLRHETPEAISLQAIGAFMEVGRPAIVLFSGGKDSSVLLNLALTAAVEQARQGRNPMVVIAHSDVGVENPEIQRLVSGEIAKAARFSREHGVTAAVRVAAPAFWDTFPVRVIGGRALPTFPDSRRDCQTDLKRLPNERELALIERDLVARASRSLPMAGASAVALERGPGPGRLVPKGSKSWSKTSRSWWQGTPTPTRSGTEAGSGSGWVTN